MNGPEILCELGRVLSDESYAIGLEPPRGPGWNLCSGSLDVGSDAISSEACLNWGTSPMVMMILSGIFLRHGITNVHNLRLEQVGPDGARFSFSYAVEA